MTFNKYILVLIIVLMPSFAFGANHYVCGGLTSGSNDGSDWTNAWHDWSNVTFTRGDTYYVCGSDTPLSAATFSTAVSGTAPITIKKAIASDHGTQTGWSASYGTKQALQAYSIRFTTSYWIWDGQVGSGSDNTSYGFVVNKPTTCATADSFNNILVEGNALRDIAIRHTATYGCESSYNKAQYCFFIYDTVTSSTVSGMELSYCYFRNCTGGVGLRRVRDSSFNNNYFLDGWGSSEHHGTHFSMRSDDPAGMMGNVKIYSNTFNGCSGSYTAPITTSQSMGTAVYGSDNVSLYNNLFMNCATTAIRSDGASTADYRNAKIYSNTVVGVSQSTVLFEVSSGGGTGNIVRNNLLANCNGNMVGANTRSNNAYYNCSNTPGTATDTGRVVLVVNPFVNQAGGDYSLAAGSLAIDAGYAIGSPYNFDILGVVRPQGSGWDIGAYEYGAGTTILRYPQYPQINIIQ